MADPDQLAYHRRLKSRAEQALCGLPPTSSLHAALGWIELAIDGEVSQWHPEVEAAEDHIEGVLFRRSETCRAELEAADMAELAEALL